MNETTAQLFDLSGQVACATASPTCPAGTTFGQLGIPAGTDFADAQLTGNAYSAGGHFGLRHGTVLAMHGDDQRAGSLCVRGVRDEEEHRHHAR